MTRRDYAMDIGPLPNEIRRDPMRSLLTCLLLAAGGLACLSAGCEKKKERIIDIKAPGVDVEGNKTKDGIEIEAGNKDKVLDIEAPGVDVEVRKRDRSKD